jgi:hypothetical protein
MQAGQKRGAGWKWKERATRQDAPFHMYFSDAKYDVIGTIPRERPKKTSLKSTPVLRMERPSWMEEIAGAGWLLTLAR